MKDKAVLFDLDGTLLDTLQDLHDSINRALTALSMPARTLDEIRLFLGNGTAKLIERSVPAGTPAETTEKVQTLFREDYALHDRDATKPYPGIPELLAALEARGVSCAIISNKFDAAVKTLAKKYFPTVRAAVGESADIRKKPAPDTVLEVLRTLGLSPSEAVYVGDSDVDIETARAAGMDCVSVTWGFRDRDFLLSRGATVTVGSCAELLTVLERRTDYAALLRTAEALCPPSEDKITNMANFSALIFDELPDLNWAGFYRWNGECLQLGPFQGKPACTRLYPGRGVCWAAYEGDRSVLVPDVHAFPGHIACDSASRSELVIPLRIGGKPVGVLDLDSPFPGRFTAWDQAGLEALARRAEAWLA